MAFTDGMSRAGEKFPSLPKKGGRERSSREEAEFGLSANGLAQAVGQRIGPAADVVFVLGFDHDASERLGARIAQDHTTGLAEGVLGGGQLAGNFRKRIERRLGFYFYVDDFLGEDFQVGDQIVERTRESNDGGKFQGGQHAVAGGGVIEKQDVAGLLAAEVGADALHFFEDVAVADGGAGQLQPGFFEGAFEAEVGHGGADDDVAFEHVIRFEIAAGYEQYAVAIDQAAGGAGKNGAVGIAVESDAQDGAGFNDALLHCFRVQRAEAGVDVTAVRSAADGHHISAERAEQTRGESAGRAIGAVNDDLHPVQSGAGKNGGAEAFEVVVVYFFVIAQAKVAACFGGVVRGKNKALEFGFDGVGKFGAGGRN